MTAPSAPVPEGAFVTGSDFGAGVTEENSKLLLNAGPLGAFVNAQDKFRDAINEQRNQLGGLADGQSALTGDTALLENVSGYASSFMSKTWKLAAGSWKQLPYDRQLGPSKNCGVSTGGLILKEKGLWRVDIHSTVQGYSRRMMFTSFPFVQQYNTYGPISVEYVIGIYNSDSSLHSARTFLEVPEGVVTYNWAGQVVNGGTRRSSAFSHTFVIDMPDDPEVADFKTARVFIMGHFIVPQDTGAGQFEVEREFRCKVHGGTKLSGFTASRWSRDVENTYQPQEVPDGGDLT